jgi:3-methyladenine DNA glycosylase Tag
MSDDEIEALLQDQRLIRHWGKLKSVRANAAAMSELADRGGMGAYLADWPRDDVVGLWADLARRFSQLGGNSGPYFLRMVGKDTFILTPSVVSALNHWDAFEGTPKSKADRARVQEVFHAWVRTSSRPLCQVSMILALSVD